MSLYFNCTHCGVEIESHYLDVGDIAECKKCGEKLNIPKDAKGESGSTKKDTVTISDTFDQDRKKDQPRSTPQPTPTDPSIKKVIVTDVDIKFSSMVFLLIKWSFAMIPAMIVLFFFYWIIFVLFLGGMIASF